MFRFSSSLVWLVSLMWLALASACSKPAALSVETELLDTNWQLFAAELANDGALISSADFVPDSFYKASVPGTVMANLRRNGLFANVFEGMNLEKVDTTPFRQAWWYRKTIRLAEGDTRLHELLFEGLNYKANIWLNGRLIASADSVENPFRMWQLQPDSLWKTGENVLAIQIIPPKRGDLTIGFVDWNPAAPDENMGLWRPVKLHHTGQLVLNETQIIAEPLLNAENEAVVELRATLCNRGSKPAQAILSVEFEGVKLSKTVELAAGVSVPVVLSADEFPELHLKNARLWWPNGLGEANLYDINWQLSQKNAVSDKRSERFGIRKIEQYVNEGGHKGWKVNGQNVLIKGAGWVDDIFLDDSDEKVRAQMDYVKQMNMNTVRLEGFWGRNKTLYEAADERGLLIMIGWSCHWEWEAYCGREDDDFLDIRSDQEMVLHTQSYVDQVKWLRNHPSMFLWVFGSDKLPLPKLEAMLNEAITKADGTRPILASCKWQEYGQEHYNTSELTGPTGVKMLGPYAYVAPSYWYIDTKAGGSYGFNTETGPGPQVPPIQSLRKMLPETSLWPIDTVWNYHCGRHEFGTLNRYRRAFDARYGASNSVEDFAQYSKLSNYEAIRPMFEAFAVNRPGSTGVIQWMLNSAWPEMFWQQYDWYMVPNGAFYGTQNACLPLNAVYHYGNGNIYLTNEYAEAFDSLQLNVRVLNLQSEELLNETLTCSIAANASAECYQMPKLDTKGETYFVVLALSNAQGKSIADKWYWLSEKQDEFDFAQTSWVGTPLKAFANLTGIRQLPQVSIEAKHSIKAEGDDWLVDVALHNPSDKLAFFVEMRLEDAKGELLVPVLWSDNYVSLLPGQTKHYTARIAQSLATEADIRFSYSSPNTK